MKKFIFLFTILCTSCLTEIPNQTYVDTVFIYFKDDRTGVCFVEIKRLDDQGAIHRSISYVPCEKIEKYLDK